MDLGSSIALVTGGARRVGRAIVEELAGAGAQVIIHHSASPDEAAALASRLPGALVVQADLRMGEGCQALLDAVRAGPGRIDLLVNNAAGYERVPFVDETDAMWDELLALNLVAPARLVRQSLGLGLRAVVNIVDVAAFQPWRRHAAYSSTKAGLLQLTRCLALELAPSVRVNAVAPGTVAFPDSFSEEDRAAIRKRIPLGREGTVADVARAVRYLAAEDYLTGVVIPVDGGFALT